MDISITNNTAIEEVGQTPVHKTGQRETTGSRLFRMEIP